MKRYVKNSAELDERFDFLLDPEFEIYVGNDRVTCYYLHFDTIGNGAGESYQIVIPIGDRDHWQMTEWIERGLDEYFAEQCDGSDYTYNIVSVKKDDTSYMWSRIPTGVAPHNLYVAEVEVVPYQNISPYGDYGIDFGTEEYMDHLTKGTPWPPEYKD